ncbi:hypothetical protein LY78DRAFT_380175 [Colletotrichum sublineola]|nr:hypothetical protein LY78DRAFT_380175 [Colletotrichum sublineola]
MESIWLVSLSLFRSLLPPSLGLGRRKKSQSPFHSFLCDTNTHARCQCASLLLLPRGAFQILITSTRSTSPSLSSQFSILTQDVTFFFSFFSFSIPFLSLLACPSLLLSFLHQFWLDLPLHRVIARFDDSRKGRSGVNLPPSSPSCPPSSSYDFPWRGEYVSHQSPLTA